MSAHRILLFLLIPAVFTFLSTRSQASDPGLPLTEDFAETTLRNATETTANWSTNEEALLLKSRGPIYGAFGPELVGSFFTNFAGDIRDTSSLALGDMDGDGKLDLVEGNRNQACRFYSNNVFPPQKTAPTGLDITNDTRDTRSIAVGDVDGDGDLDVVAGNFGSTNRLYVNNGMSFPFSAAGSFDITTDTDDTASVALGDLDGDGDLDLVAGNNGTPSRLYLNNGTSDPFGGVTGATITSDAFATNSIALGDLDSDGDLDLVVANFQQPSQIYLNNGTDDPFAAVTAAEFAPLSSDLEPVIALGDMNGDGNLDIVKVGGEIEEFDQIYFNNGTANPFEGVTGVPFNSDEDLSFSVAVGDVDSDGDLDIITGNVGLFSEGDQNRLYLNNGTSEPFSGVMGTDLSADINHTNALALGDIDGDGDLDAIAGNRNQIKKLYLNEGTSNPFDGGTDLTPELIRAEDLAVGDIDGDGDLDLLLTDGVQGRFTRLFLNNGTAAPFMGVVPSDIATDASPTNQIEIQDFNGDGRLDLAISSSDPPLSLYLNNGSTDPFAAVQGKVISASTVIGAELISGDLNRDGHVDLVARAPLRDSVFLNNGTQDPFAGVTPSRIGFATESFSIQVMELGDLDRDGYLDLVIGTGPGRLDRFYLNNGTSSPFEGVAGITIGTATHQTSSVGVRDMDGDGDLDIVITSFSFNRPDLLYLNNGSDAPFADVSPSNVGSKVGVEQSVDLNIGDVNGDGDLDLVITDGANNEILFLNNGSSNPFDGDDGISLSGGLGSAQSLALADFDRDGDLDLAVGGSGNRRTQLYLNNSPFDPFSSIVPSGIGIVSDLTRSVAVGDVDRDGAPDVVAGNFGQPNRLYSNNGKPDPFEGVAGENITADAQQTTSVALGDVDKDGDLDLVAGNSGQPNRFYPNNGNDAPFEGSTGVNITADSDSTTSVALGDIDRDGDEDLVAGNFGQTNRMYLNNGTSEPWTGVTGVDITEDAHNTNSVALGDVDRDGFLDLVAGNFGQPNRLYLNQLNEGPFSGGHEIDSASGLAVSTVLGDVDGDGDLDLIQGKGQVPGSAILPKMYLNSGTADPFGGVVATDIIPTASNTFSLALGDLDGDEDLDLVLNSFADPMRLFLNNGTSAPFSGVAAINITSETQVNNNAVRVIALGDVDGDEDLDIVASRGAFPKRLYLNNGTSDPFAGVAGSEITSDTGSVSSFALADFDGDDDLDLGASYSGVNGTNRLYLNNGTLNPFQGVIGSGITSDASGSHTLAFGDLNGDGSLDIVAGNSLLPSRLYLNNGTADPFVDVDGIDINPTIIHRALAVALGDVDGDEDLDLVLGNILSGPNRLYLNYGGPDPFSGATGIDLGSELDETYGLALGDMDRDGDLDLVVGNNRATDRLLLNNLIPNPYLSGVDISDDAHNTNSVALGDINLDGYLDVVAGNFNQPNRWYRNNRTANPFDGVTGFDAGAETGNTEEIALADINRDGRPDLITGNLGQPNRVYLNVDNMVSQIFVAVEGIDITSDAHNTRSVAAFDMDRDGSLDIVVGNDGQPNRLYTRRRFNTASNLATSLTVDMQPGDIHRIVLDSEQSLPPNTAIDYWVSSNGGLRWNLVRPAEVFSLPNLGSDLRWRAVMKSLSPVFSPRLDTLFLDLAPGLKADPGSVDFMNRVPNSGPSDPVAVTISNEGESNVTISGVLLGGADTGEFVFSNDSGQIVLNPGGTRTFDVAFDPTSLGLKTATVTITSDDIDRPIVLVSLVGTGAEPPTPTFTPTSTRTPSATMTRTPTVTPTPAETNYDIHPEVPDGLVNAGDLLEWLERLKTPEEDPSLLFDFARFWKSGDD